MTVHEVVRTQGGMLTWRFDVSATSSGGWLYYEATVITHPDTSTIRGKSITFILLAEKEI